MGWEEAGKKEEQKEGNTDVEMKCMPVLGRVIAAPTKPCSIKCVWVNLSLKIRESLFHWHQCMPLMSAECIHKPSFDLSVSRHCIPRRNAGLRPGLVLLSNL